MPHEIERQLGSLLEMVDEVVWSLAWEAWTPLYVSPTAERVYGWPITDLLRAEHWLKIFPLEETQRMIREFEFAAMSGIDTFSGEYRFFNRERGERLAYIRGKVIRDESGKPIRAEGMTSDVTEMRRAMKELEEHRQKVFALSKLNTLGELASGIGHELNTPLSAILSKIARVECAIDGEKEKGLLRESMEIIERISQIVDGLKQLSRNRQFDNAREKIDPAFSIEQALSLSRARFSNHGFRIEFFRPPKSLRCIGNQTTLFQALVNLLNNAFDALDEKQEAKGRDGTEVVRITFEKLGSQVSIRVVDTGIGITEDFKPKLFEAFQTTKPEGKGTGLGLNISRRLLRADGGDLRLVSTTFGNTEFEIILPIAQ